MADLRATAEGFLHAHTKAVVAVLEGDRPKGSLMLYAYGDDGMFYFGTKKSSPKYRALRQKPAISIVVVDGTPDPLRTVEVQGIAEFIPDAETAATLAMLESKNKTKFYVKDAADFTMFRVKPASLKWLDATSGELQIEQVM
jgi:general stress protein 26